MDRLEAMTILLAAIDHGSLSAASRRLHIPLATVSRRVSELENHLNIRLLLRGTRKLVLTDAGRAYVASCRRILEDIAESERIASGEYHAPQGELVISVPQVIGRNHMVPVVTEFLHTYPDIRMRLQFSDRVVNLLEEHVDLAMRVGELPDSSLVAIRVGLIRPVLCASPAYLKERGTPKKPADLTSHDCVVYEAYAGGRNWEFLVAGAAQPIDVPWRLMVSSAEAAIIAATAGAGIARVLSYQIDEHVKSRVLVKLLEGCEPRPTPVSLIYPSQRQVPLKLRAFLDFSTSRLRERLGYKNP
jgi:DNA-binding transcriptional LysR family regulator